MQVEAPLVSNVWFSAFSLLLILPPLSPVHGAPGVCSPPPLLSWVPLLHPPLSPRLPPSRVPPLLHLSLLLRINTSGDKLLPPAHLFLCTNL